LFHNILFTQLQQKNDMDAMETPRRKELIEKLNSAGETPILSIEATSETPEVLFDAKKGFISIGGRSLPENAKEFYNPLIEWVTNYRQSPVKGTKVILNFEYFNTASSKLIWALIDELGKLKEQDPETTLEWHYLKDDDEMLEAGEDYAEMVGLNFHYVSYE
jgi:hypothetical protein